MVEHLTNLSNYISNGIFDLNKGQSSQWYKKTKFNKRHTEFTMKFAILLYAKY